MAKKVAVIGCGFTGLCTLKHFSLDPEFQVVGFEQAGSIGGIWKYPAGCEQNVDQPDTSPFYCRIYRDLQTNVPKDIMSMEDFPFPQGSSSFCNSQTVMDYLLSYAEHFDLLRRIKFRCRIVQVIPVTSAVTRGQKGHFPHQWTITYENLENKTVMKDIFDAVALCNGHYHKPHLLELPGLSTFTGDVIHSSAYRVPETYRNKNVLIIGGSISACDITIEIHRLANKVIICKRKPKPLFPTKLGNVQETEMPRCITSDSCILSDGTVVKIDSVIFCTGYEFHCPFIHGNCRLSITRGRITPLYHHLLNCYFPSMAFFYIIKISVFTPVLDYQIKYFKAVLKREISLPSLDVMLQEADDEYQSRMKDGLREHDAHLMDQRLWPYTDQLAEELGISSYEPVYRKMFEKGKEIVFGSPLNGKRYILNKLDSENFFTQKPGQSEL